MPCKDMHVDSVIIGPRGAVVGADSRQNVQLRAGSFDAVSSCEVILLFLKAKNTEKLSTAKAKHDYEDMLNNVPGYACCALARGWKRRIEGFDSH